MPKTKLTSAAVEKIKPPLSGQVEYFDRYLPAFGLRVSYKGTKSWFVTTRVNGQLVRLTIGRYPAIPLVKARDEARRLFNLAQAGTDPRLEKIDEKRKRDERRRNTFGKCADEFLETYVARRLRPSTMREYKRFLAGPDTHHWQRRPIESIAKRDVLDVLDSIEGRGSPGAAARALAYLGKFFNWCAERDIIETVPTDRIRPSHPPTSRDRVLSEEELVYIVSAVEADETIFGPLFKLLLLTGQRRGEVAGMKWSEIRSLESDAAVWEIPGNRTKNKQTHIVPLVSGVLAMLNGLPRTGDLVFSVTGETPVSGFGKAKARLDAAINQLREHDHLAPLPPWTLHDLRRTMVTVMNEKLGIAPHVVEAVVNHMSGSAKAGIAGVYNRALYLDDRRKACEAWSGYLARYMGS
jgi:integrase